MHYNYNSASTITIGLEHLNRTSNTFSRKIPSFKVDENYEVKRNVVAVSNIMTLK